MKRYIPNNWPIDNKKAAPKMEADSKTFQNHSSMFQLGYQDALSEDWSKLPVKERKQLLFGYTQAAMKRNNPYLLGYACGVQDAIRRVAA